MFSRTKTFIQVWNYLRVSKGWHKFHFWVNYPFKSNSLTVDHTFSHTPWLVHYVQCLHIIGQTTFPSLPSASIKQENKAKTNPGKDVSEENATYGHPTLPYTKPNHKLPQSVKGTLHFFWKYANFTTPQKLNSWVLPFLNPFSRSPGLTGALLA